MRAKLLSLLLVVGMSLSLLAAAMTIAPKASPVQRTDWFEVVPLEPDLAAELKAKGESIEYPTPSVNAQATKFNPEGQVIPPLSTAPDQYVLVLFVEFADAPPGGPAAPTDLALFDDMLFGTDYDPYTAEQHAAFPGVPTDRTLYNYFQEASYGQVEVMTNDAPSAMGWIQAGNPYAYYCNYDNGFGSYPNNAQGLVVDAVRAIDDVVDFSDYAADGTVPNLFVVHRGTGAEWSGTSEVIWSHSWSLWWLDSPDIVPGEGYLTNDGVYIDRYAMMPEVGGDLTGYRGTVTGPFPPTVGVYAHEYGHVLGLPDEYDYGYDGRYSEGTGNYSLMAGGSWNRYPNNILFSGNSPSHLDAWSKYRLGFVEPIEVTDPVDVVLPPVETNATVYKMVVPGSDGMEYFLFENRQQVGFDQGLGRFGAHGLAIYHVDDAVFSRNYSRPNEAENWKENRFATWPKPAWNGETHYAISLVQADDQWDLEHYVNRGDAGDLYPGAAGNHSFASETLPNSSCYYFWPGGQAPFGFPGITVDNIQEEGLNVTAALSYEPPVDAEGE